MAIKFVDKELEDDGKPAKAEPPKVAQRPAGEPPAETAPFEGELPGLLHAKPEPKKRGRKKAFGS